MGFRWAWTCTVLRSVLFSHQRLLRVTAASGITPIGCARAILGLTLGHQYAADPCRKGLPKGKWHPRLDRRPTRPSPITKVDRKRDGDAAGRRAHKWAEETVSGSKRREKKTSHHSSIIEKHSCMYNLSIKTIFSNLLHCTKLWSRMLWVGQGLPICT